ncbi:MAG TPA: GNAT family N-acetyltransferase [Deinococcales bacterium]|nr:GNAT family N-acetyltransferase [Deinococcales bacterium]
MRIRPAAVADAEELAGLLNDIIAEGGKTAIATPLTGPQFAEWFIIGPHCLSCLVATTDGAIVGFQALERFHRDLPRGTADIATFVAGRARASGSGRRLAEATLALAEKTGVQCIRAVIQRSNGDAIGYYRSLGFRGDADRAGGETVVLLRRIAPASDA